MDTPVEVVRDLFRVMVTSRTFEGRVRTEFARGEIPGFVHTYVGQEAVAAGVMASLRATDSITSTHRGHEHCVAKGCDLNGMMAELHGKSTGLCKGKGGSLHIADVTKGIWGANGVVGGGLPLAVGAAYHGTGAVCACFLGDGAVVAPPEQENHMAARIPDTRVQVLAGTGHAAPVEQPEIFAPVLQAAARAGEPS